jgi:hypothetical protein
LHVFSIGSEAFGGGNAHRGKAQETSPIDLCGSWDDIH